MEDAEHAPVRLPREVGVTRRQEETALSRREDWGHWHAAPEGRVPTPVLQPGTPAYKRARAIMAENENLLRQVCGSRGDGLTCRHNDLPTLFVAALVDARVAAGLRGRSFEYEVTPARGWSELLELHPLWCPAYVQFARRLRGADALLELCGSDILDGLVRRGCDPLRAVIPALLMRDDAKREIESYAAKVSSIQVTELVEKELMGGRNGSGYELARGLAARALLYAVLGLPEAAELARSTVESVMSAADNVWNLGTERADHSVQELLHTSSCLSIWGLVHSLVDLGDLWEEHFSPGAEARARSGSLRLPADLTIPEVGGERFAQVCRAICDDVAAWYRGEPAAAVPVGAVPAAQPGMPHDAHLVPDAPSRVGNVVVLVAGGQEARPLVPAEQNAPDPAAAKARKHAERFRTPRGAAWGDVSMSFKDRHTVAVKVKRVSGIYHYAQMGMADRRSSRPTKQWELLQDFADGHGTLTWRHPNACRKNQKRREYLARDLRRFFGIERDPFRLTDGGKGWQALFRIDPD